MTEQLLYLGDDPHRFLAVYRPPERTARTAGRAAGAAVRLGRDRLAPGPRDWAAHLAAHGHPVIRLDLPGTGDSAGGPADPGRRRRGRPPSGRRPPGSAPRRPSQTVVGIGIGLGGLLVYEAAARGELDHIVLWATPGRGRTLVRELSAFSALETARIVESGSPEPPPLPEQMLAPGGFVLSAETVAALSAVDLATRPLAAGDAGAAPRPRRDQARCRAAGSGDGAGASLTVASGEGLLRDARGAGPVTHAGRGVRHGAGLARRDYRGSAARSGRRRGRPARAGAAARRLQRAAAHGSCSRRPPGRHLGRSRRASGSP